MSMHLSPRRLAQAVGVSESSIKRWVDAGRIRSKVTAGGHRRIPLEEAIRFIRETGARIADHQTLGTGTPDAGPSGSLHGNILRGRTQDALDLVRALYASGMDTAAIIDGPFSKAMALVGTLWHDRGDEGVFLEHRATQIGLRIIHDLRSLQTRPPASAPLAIGGAPRGDPYALPSLAVATVLESAGFATSNLGPETPDSAFLSAIENLRPELVWLSVTSIGNKSDRTRTVRTLAEMLENVGGALVIGGQASEGLDIGDGKAAIRIGSLVELAAFGRGLQQNRRKPGEEGG